jgi:hypothetical protein
MEEFGTYILSIIKINKFWELFKIIVRNFNYEKVVCWSCCLLKTLVTKQVNMDQW